MDAFNWQHVVYEDFCRQYRRQSRDQEIFIIFYILCGIGAAMAQVLMDTASQVPMVGASGAIGGVLGAYLINHPNARVLVLIPYIILTIIKIRALYVLGFWFILQFYFKWWRSGLRSSYWWFCFWNDFDIVLQQKNKKKN